MRQSGGFRFQGNPLDRSSVNKMPTAFSPESIEKADGKWVLFRQSKILFDSCPASSHTTISETEVNPAIASAIFSKENIKPENLSYQLKLLSLKDILHLLKLSSVEELVKCYADYILLLGNKIDRPDQCYFAIDLSHLNSEVMNECDFLKTGVELDGRKLLVGVPEGDCAIAGQVLALFRFHKNNQHLGITGELTRSVEGGRKRTGIETGKQ